MNVSDATSVGDAPPSSSMNVDEASVRGGGRVGELIGSMMNPDHRFQVTSSLVNVHDDIDVDDVGVDNSTQSMQQYVDHTYRDFAIIDDDQLRCLDEDPSSLDSPANASISEARERLRDMGLAYGPIRKNAGGVSRPFPGKLLEVLDRTDLSDIIDWMPHGRAFLVRKPKTFAADVLPRFFKQTKFLSFTRQLNLWGFKRITRGPDAGAYYHELFLRGRPYMAMRMKRQKIKGTGMKLMPNPQSEPNFYDDWPAVPIPLMGSSLPLPPMPLYPLGQHGGASLVGGRGRSTGIAIGGGGGIRNNVALNADAAMLNALLCREQRGDGRGNALDTAPSSDPSSLAPHFLFHPGLQGQRYGEAGSAAANLVGNAYGDLLRSTLRISPFGSTSIFSYLSERSHPSSNNGGVVVGGGPSGMRGMMAMMGGGHNPNNDPNSASAYAVEMEGKIPEGLSSVVLGRSHQQNFAAIPNKDSRFGLEGEMSFADGGMMDPQWQQQPQLSQDRLLMERLRNLDKLTSAMASGEGNIGYVGGSHNKDHLDSSLMNARREANHLEKLAPVQRAKDRSLVKGFGGGDDDGSGAGVGGEGTGSTASEDM